MLGIACIFQKIIHIGLNSDSLYPVNLYRDLFVDHYGIKGWYLPPAPYFFPDLLLMFISMAVTTDIGYGYLLYAFLYYACFVGVLFKILSYAGDRMAALCYSLGVYLLLVALQNMASNWTLAWFLFLPTFHAGGLLIGLLLIERILSIMVNGISVWKGFTLFILVFLGTVSDSLVIPHFLIPIVISIFILGFIKNIPLKSAVPSVILIGISTGISVQFLKWFQEGAFGFYVPYFLNQTSLPDFQHESGTFIALLRDYWYFLLPVEWPYLLIILLLIFFSSILFLEHKGKMSFLGKPNRSSNKIVLFVVFITFLPVLCSLTAVVYSGVWISVSERRYLLPLYVFPLLSLTLILFFLHHRIPRRVKTVGIVAVLLLCSIRILPSALSFQLHQCKLPYPESVQSLDTLANRLDLKYGYADYWHAKRLTIFSKAGLRINQVHQDLMFHWAINNKSWYQREINDPDSYPLYTFIVTNGLSKDQMLSRFGDPAIRYDCDGLKIYVYNRQEDTAFRNYLRTRVTDDYHAPAQPNRLQHPKKDGTSWDAKGNIVFDQNEEISVKFNPPAEGNLLELSADNNDEYDIELYSTSEKSDHLFLGRITAPKVLLPGLQKRYVFLPESLKGHEISKLMIKPGRGDNHYSVGHVFIYEDPYPSIQKTDRPDSVHVPSTPRSLRKVKQDGIGWDAPGNMVISATSELQVDFDPPATGNILEISADNNDKYEVHLYSPQNELGRLTVPVAAARGLQRRYLLLPESVDDQTGLSKLTIKPVQGDGRYSIGHVLIYDARTGTW